MTREDILAKVKRNEIQIDEASALLDKFDRIHPPPAARTPPKFKVASASGWCSIYFDGLRRPCTLPAALWLEVLDNSERLRKFIEENKQNFRNRN